MIKVENISYQQASLKIKNQINELLQVVWPTTSDSDEHDSDLIEQCFYIMVDNRIVSYAAVVQLKVIINEKSYQIGGLSCVATLPVFRRQGFSSKIVARATKWMEDNLDFGVFTCAPDLKEFYQPSISPIIKLLIIYGSLTIIIIIFNFKIIIMHSNSFVKHFFKIFLFY